MQTCRKTIVPILFFFGILLQAVGQGTAAPKIVSFPSGDKTLSGYLWVPEGEGPFAAVVWNYGHKQPLMKQGSPSQFSPLARFYVDKQYAFFIPDRRAEQEDKGSSIEAADAKNQDIIAALSWLRQQSFIIATKVAVSGTLTGAVQALLAAERDSTIRAVVLFSPGALSWNENASNRAMIQRAVQNCEVPTFLIQPQNDKSLGPIQAVGTMLSAKGGLNRSKVYLPYGDPKAFGKVGMKVWGKDVLAFLDAAMK